MDAILTAFVAAGLAEWGDKTQLLVALLAARSGRPAIVFAALFVAVLLSNVMAALAGLYIAETITLRALSFLLALALLFAGAAGLVVRRAPNAGSLRLPLFAAAAILLLAAEFGDRTQFLTFALAGRFGSAPLAAAGATAGTLVACLPALLLAGQFQKKAPIRAIRYPVAAAFLLIGFAVAMNALRLTA